MTRSIYRVRNPRKTNRLAYTVTLRTERGGGLFSHSVNLRIDAGGTRNVSILGVGQSIHEAFTALRDELAAFKAFLA